MQPGNYVIVPKYSEIRKHMKQFMITIITKRNDRHEAYGFLIYKTFSPKCHFFHNIEKRYVSKEYLLFGFVFDFAPFTRGSFFNHALVGGK